MTCPHCNLEAIIFSSSTEIQGDDSPDRQTEVFLRMTYHCRNPRCQSYGAAIGETRVRVYPDASSQSSLKSSTKETIL